MIGKNGKASACSLAFAACLALVPCVPAAEPEPVAVIYTKDNAPATPQLDELGLKASVSRHGVTWTFEQPARVGRFVNGDWYVS